MPPRCGGEYDSLVLPPIRNRSLHAFDGVENARFGSELRLVLDSVLRGCEAVAIAPVRLHQLDAQDSPLRASLGVADTGARLLFTGRRGVDCDAPVVVL